MKESKCSLGNYVVYSTGKIYNKSGKQIKVRKQGNYNYVCLYLNGKTVNKKLDDVLKECFTVESSNKEEKKSKVSLFFSKLFRKNR